MASSDFLEKHPDIVKDFLQEHGEATLYINENSDKAQEIVNKEIESTTGKAIDTEILKSAFARIKMDTTLNKDAIMVFAKLSKEEGFIGRIPEVDDVFAAEIN